MAFGMMAFTLGVQYLGIVNHGVEEVAPDEIAAGAPVPSIGD